MKLHHSPASPFVRKVMIVIHETGLADRVTLETVVNTPLAPNPATAAANPLSKIPALERPDGPALFDSAVICRYLDTLHGGRSLYPGGAALWPTLTLEALGDGVCDAAVAAIYEMRFREEAAWSQDWIAAQKLKIARALDALESQWLSHLAGPLDVGVIAVAAALGYLDFRLVEVDWRATRPRLAAWHAGFADRDSYRATTPVG